MSFFTHYFLSRPSFLCFCFRLFPDHSGNSSASGQNGESNSHHHANNEDHDDDTEKEGVPPKPDFHWEDNGLHHQTLLTLNKMRKNKHFCDVILQVRANDFCVKF